MQPACGDTPLLQSRGVFTERCIGVVFPRFFRPGEADRERRRPMVLQSARARAFPRKRRATTDPQGPSASRSPVFGWAALRHQPTTVAGAHTTNEDNRVRYFADKPSSHPRSAGASRNARYLLPRVDHIDSVSRSHLCVAYAYGHDGIRSNALAKCRR